MYGAIPFPPGLSDTRFLLDTYVEPALSRIEGVGNVEIWGMSDKQVLVEMDQDKMSSHGINMFQTVNDLRSQNVIVPGGWIVEGGKKIYLRSVGRYQTVQELSETVVDPEHQLTLKDIASVSYKTPKKYRSDRINGQESMGFTIFSIF